MIRSHLCGISNYEFVFYVDKWTCNNMRSLIEYSEAGNPAPPFYNIFCHQNDEIPLRQRDFRGGSQREVKGAR